MCANARLAILAFLCLAVAGCATTRSEIKLGGPTAVGTPAPMVIGKTVAIRTVKDERTFEEAPSDPSTPSLGFEGASKSAAEVKARAIGRKRNAYGKALGDVMLENGQTVESVVREHLVVALQQAGYQSEPSLAEAGATPLVMDVRIKQFWAWLRPGFWAITLSAKIAVDFDVVDAVSPATVSVFAEDSRQVVTDSAWMEIVDKALTDFRAQTTTKFETRR